MAGGAMLLSTRVTFLLSTALCVVDALLVTASLFIADRAPYSVQFFAVSIVVSLIFAAIAVILFGVQRHLTAIAPGATGADRHWFSLLAYLIAGGAMLALALALLTYAILARINQGFAVFG